MEQYKRILLKEFDSRQKVITELTNLEAILNYPKERSCISVTFTGSLLLLTIF